MSDLIEDIDEYIAGAVAANIDGLLPCKLLKRCKTALGEREWVSVVIQRRCKKCNAPREGKKCWKCGEQTFIAADGWMEAKLPPIDKIRELAREAGYAIGVHGSQERDFDLIASPWVDTCSDAVDLMIHIADGINGKLIGTVEKKPHGRLGCNIQIDGYYKVIDLSVCAKIDAPEDKL